MAHYYSVKSQICEITPEEATGVNQPMAWILTVEEAEKDEFLSRYGFLTKKYRQEIRFCKAEAHLDVLYGTVYVPPKGRREAIAFQYVICSDRIIFIEDGGFVRGMFLKMKDNVTRKTFGLGHLLADFLDLLTANDLIFLTELENKMAKLEDEVLSGSLDDFNHKITRYRRAILVYSHYYLQFSDTSNVLQQNDHGFFTTEELTAFRLFGERVSRLHEEALMLREYSTQIREVYQAQIDIRQNKVMKILTVVTTIFLPLTLLVGWYGMNFQMPELQWRYGYPVFVLASAAVVALCLYICRKKHFL
ncbi:MAG: CorA family divalent cation transporter [Eubacteriales bacterium]|nr:CorA family divalent cation transporter [Eubacteriales bacterium]